MSDKQEMARRVFKEKGFKLKDTYIRCNHKMRCKHIACGSEHWRTLESTLSIRKENVRCLTCNNNLYRELLETRGYLLIGADQRTTVGSDVHYLCLCGEPKRSRSDSLVKTIIDRDTGRSGCHGCFVIRVRNTLSEHGCSLIEGTLVDSRSRLKYYCRCNRKLSSESHIILTRGPSCNYCYNTHRTSYEEVCKTFSDRGDRLLTEKYLSKDQIIKYLCGCCGEKYKTIYRNYRKGHDSCPGRFKNKSKVTSIERYNCDYPMQNPEVYEKQMKSAFRRKEYTFPSGNTVTVQGYEHFCLDHLVRQGYKERHIRTGASNMPKITYFFGGITRRYYPDLLITRHKRSFFIEVKSTYTLTKESDKIMAKMYAASLLYPIELSVYSEKGECLDIYRLEQQDRYETFTFSSGREIVAGEHVQFALRDLLGDTELREEEEIEILLWKMPRIFYEFEDKSLRYYPSILVDNNGDPFFVEVKSEYTLTREYDKNMAKMYAASLVYPIELRVYNEKGRYQYIYKFENGVMTLG